MQQKDYIFWVALPPVVDDIEFLTRIADLAEPLIDLRYGSKDYKRYILKKSLQYNLAGLTVFIDYHDKDTSNFALNSFPQYSRIILTSVKKFNKNLEISINEFKSRHIIIGIEIDNKNDAFYAHACGADFLVASGNEAYGPVSEKTSLVLVQELLEDLETPLILRGSLGPQATAGVLAAGCSGCILDSQVLLLKDSPISDQQKKSLMESSISDISVIGIFTNRPYRFLCKDTRNNYSTLVNEEKRIFLENTSPERRADIFGKILSTIMLDGFNDTATNFPVGQGIVFAQSFAEKGLGVRDVLKIYNTALGRSIEKVKINFPFSPGSHIAKIHNVKYPLVQGPMACIADNPNLADKVAEQGALPFVALAGLSSQQRRDLLKNTRSVLKEKPFGAGIVNFDSLEDIEEQIQDLLAFPPNFITIAGGDSGLVKRFEEAGIGTYIYAPTKAHLKNFLEHNITGIILEGYEAGGHVGPLGSLILWELALGEFVKLDIEEGPKIRVLLAGGMATARGALIAATLFSPLSDKRIVIGLQIGTAYLLTNEAVEAGTISIRYQNMLLNGNRTVITGQSVNLPTRWLFTQSTNSMLNVEFKLEKENYSFSERKQMLEASNIDNVQMALGNRNEKIQKQNTSTDGAYMCGQVVVLQKHPMRMANFHEELTVKAKQLSKTCLIPERRWEHMKDAIAIVGMGCVFPDANNIDEYWKNIMNRRSSIRQLSKERCNLDAYFDPERGKMYKTYSKIGAFIEGFKKDPLKFHIPPVSAQFIDRIQFLMLEAAYQALDDAGYFKKTFPKERTAVLIGSNGKGETGVLHHIRAYWSKFVERIKATKEFEKLPDKIKDSILSESEKAFNQDMPELSEDSCSGTFGSIIASRISHCFNLGSVSLVLDAACASSLAAIDIGVRGLRERRFDMVLAGAVDGYLNVGSYLLFSSLGAISAKGSFPFDERADGLVLGEGAGLVVLKRLDDAMLAGDKIYAIIRNTDFSSDGRVKGITAPDAKGQIRALERVYEMVPFSPDTVSLIEAHGTGTWAGDEAEIESLIKFFQRYTDEKRFIGLGSVKSMIGHLKSAAGIAGLIKVALAFYKKVLPPMINCEQPRKDVDWENSPFYLLTEPHQWESGYLPRRAAINSFGFGGVNYHAILEEAPTKNILSYNSQEGTEPVAEILFFRAKTRNNLIRLIIQTREKLIQAERPDIRMVSSDLLRSAAKAGPILTIVGDNIDKIISNLDKACNMLYDKSRSEFFLAQGIYFSQRPLAPEEKVAFLFPGLGSQYPGMGNDLPANIPLIREIFNKIDSDSIRYTGSSILELLVSDKDLTKRDSFAELLIRSDYNHPAMLAMEAGIFQVLSSAGIKPDMVAGHSLGEYFALYAAGVFDLDTAIEITTIRGNSITQHCFNNGAMASIGLSPDLLKSIIKKAPGFAAVANKNCPVQTVISGDIDTIKNIVADMEAKGVACKMLPAASAYHTRLLKPCSKSFREFLNKFTINLPNIPVQSNLTGEDYKIGKDFTTRLRDMLVEHLIQPVEFIKNICSLYDNGARLFIEIGPGSVLSSFVDNILINKPHWTIQTNLPQRSATLQLFHALAFCAAKGLPVDTSNISPEYKQQILHRTTPMPMKNLVWSLADTKLKISDWPDLINESLLDQDESMVKNYLKNRYGFVKDMLKQDFQNFKKGARNIESEEKVFNGDDLQERIIDLISRKTGYPQDHIDIDYDVEAELGLDSIKQVEIIREVSRELNINFGVDPKSQRYKITTPRKLIEACRKFIVKNTHSNKVELSSQVQDAHVLKREWRTNCHRWVCRKVEVPLSDKIDTTALKSKRILLLVDKYGPSNFIKSRLEFAGAVVSAVSLLDKSAYQVWDFDLVLNMSSYRENDIITMKNINKWWKDTGRRANFILNIAKLAASLMRQKDKKMLWIEVTSLGGELGSNIIKTIPAKAGAGLGIIRCLKCEFSDSLEVLYLDFSPYYSQKYIAENILNELMQCRKHPEIGYADGKRFEIHWQLEDLKDKEQKFPLNSKSVVLAIGGARGITASICREIAKRSKAKFIIVGKNSIGNNIELEKSITFDEAKNMILGMIKKQGRTVTPAEINRLAWMRVWESERSHNIKHLKNIAGTVIYRQCDITNVDDVNRLIDELKRKHTCIDLVIQGASDLILKSIEDISVNEFIENMKSKALGTVCLLTALSGVNVGTFINLSSVAGRWGNIGQASYAAGHEIAAIILAGARKKQIMRGVNIFFGAWLNVGMVRVGDIMERLNMRGSNFITNKAGSEFFIKEFASGSNENVAFCGQKSLRYSRSTGVNTTISDLPASLLDGVQIISGERAKGYKTFDLKRDRIIAEHYVDYAEPIMPGVVSIEMIAQTASALSAPELCVTRITDIVFPHPGIFPRKEPKKFYSSVKLLSSGKDNACFSGKMYSIFLPPGGGKKRHMCHARCKIYFGYRKTPDEQRLLLVNTGIGDCRVDARPLWDTEVRQGRQGIFRTINSFASVTRDGVEGEIFAPQTQGLGKLTCLYNPMIIDGALDLVNLSTDIFQGNESSLVGKIKSIDIFQSTADQSKRHCRTRIQKMTETGIIYDAEAMNAEGKVIERIQGVEKIKGMSDVNSLPEPIWELLRENPIQKDIKRLLGYKQKFVLTQVPISLIRSALKTNEKGVLSEQLMKEEKIQYNKLKHTKRRLEWLAGRIVSKAAIRIYLDKDALALTDMAIRAFPDNSPYVFTNAPKRMKSLPYISISHSNDVAVSLAAQIPGIGIDVEKINDSILEIADEFSGDDEVAQISVCTACPRKVVLTIIWTMKEAYIKAYRSQDVSAKDIVIENAKVDGNYIICELRDFDNLPVRSIAFQNNDYVYAVSRLII